MNTEDLRVPTEPPYTKPYVRWCGRLGRVISPAYPIGGVGKWEFPIFPKREGGQRGRESSFAS